MRTTTAVILAALLITAPAPALATDPLTIGIEWAIKIPVMLIDAFVKKKTEKPVMPVSQPSVFSRMSSHN